MNWNTCCVCFKISAESSSWPPTALIIILLCTWCLLFIPATFKKRELYWILLKHNHVWERISHRAWNEITVLFMSTMTRVSPLGWHQFSAFYICIQPHCSSVWWKDIAHNGKRCVWNFTFISSSKKKVVGVFILKSWTSSTPSVTFDCESSVQCDSLIQDMRWRRVSVRTGARRSDFMMFSPARVQVAPFPAISQQQP